jgi:hypothetical protein
MAPKKSNSNVQTLYFLSIIDLINQSFSIFCLVAKLPEKPKRDPLDAFEILQMIELQACRECLA